VPDVDDTAGALLALATFLRTASNGDRQRGRAAAAAGVTWLLQLQNADGGWPTFCRGWGKLPFDRSGADLTAHALRALHAWQPLRPRPIEKALDRGLRFLARQQRDDGSWTPLWFGNQDHPEEANPVYGTARVLLAYRDLGLESTEPAHRGLQWLGACRGRDGGWSGGATPDRGPHTTGVSTVEETAVAVEALASAEVGPSLHVALGEGVDWLIEAVESGRHRQPAPIGFYFARLWYYEKLYPLSFTVASLGHALGRLASRR
jgi:squalene-hopene/tetraprenyl-beta-curcumene cyclase